MAERIIAVCSTTGPQSGKSTYLERHVLRNVPYATHMRFSEPIISFLMDGLRVLHSCNDYETVKRMEILPGISGRDFMIAAGDNVRRALRDSFYAEILEKRLDTVNGPVVIDDLCKIPELETLVNYSKRTGAGLLIVNVRKPGFHLNDCEFDVECLYRTAATCENPRLIRYMEVTWDGKGSFVTMRKARPEVQS